VQGTHSNDYNESQTVTHNNSQRDIHDSSSNQNSSMFNFNNGHRYSGGGTLNRPVYDDVVFISSSMPNMVYGSNGLQNTTLRTNTDNQNSGTQNNTQHDISTAMNMIQAQMTNIETSFQNKVSHLECS
jgi:hypothetical protein